MAYTNLSTRAAGYLVTADNWNELVNNFLFVATSAGLLKHEVGGMEFDASAITTGGIVRGASSGVMSILAGFLDGSGRVKHEMGGIEADVSAIVAGGLLKGSGTGSMAILARGSALQHLRVNSGGSDLEWAAVSLPTIAVKTSNQTVNNSETLVNDSALTVAVNADTNYLVWMQLGVLSNATADFKYTFTTPSSPTSSAGFDVGGNDTAHDNYAALTSAMGSQAPGTDEFNVSLWGILRNGSNAGNLQLQWAQGTATSVDTIVGDNSFLAVFPA
jgi:hypothetical protein